MFDNLGSVELLFGAVFLIGLVVFVLRKGDRREEVNLSERPHYLPQGHMTQPPSSELRSKALDEKFCQECGSIIRAKAEICPKCGVRQAVMSSSGLAAGRSRVGAALFAFGLGWIGAHKFYLGRVGEGVLYAMFFWSGIPLVVSIIEGLIYLSMTDEAFAAKYG
ncbi:MAG: NINE protein [Nitrospira sp.]|jgi:TM2 domain-containing membrane protein YozV|nr:NINE protein [Nitrospira sp.]